MKFRHDALAALTLMLIPLAACKSAAAMTPNSSNPAHCVAAFSYGRTLASATKKPDISLSVQSTARAMFELDKMKANGSLAAGKAEGTALALQLGNNSKAMMGLLRDCATHQDDDPAFRAVNDSGQLMAAARKIDPVCQSNAECKSSVK